MKFVAFTLLVFSSVVSAETLITDHFIIQIERECEEGNVTCHQVKFTYSSKEMKEKQTIIGNTLHTKCADGVTPCAFQGYEFLSGGLRYFIGRSGILEVVDSEGNQRLLEKGKWQD